MGKRSEERHRPAALLHAPLRPPAHHACHGDPPIPRSQMTTPNEGRQGFHTFPHDLGTAAGWVRLTCNMYTIKDKTDVYYDGDLVATTGDYVSGTGTIWFWYDGPQNGPDVCEVQVGGPRSGTGWDYTLHCPDPDWTPSN